MRNLTASGRSALIRLASSLPAGSPERRAILAGLNVHAGPRHIGASLKTFRQAFERMEIMFSRGGPDGMTRDTLSRVNKATDPDKLAGIVQAIEKWLTVRTYDLTEDQHDALHKVLIIAQKAQGSEILERKEVSGGGIDPRRPHDLGTPQNPALILPAGFIDFTTRASYWDDGVNEIWEAKNGDTFIVHPPGSKPFFQIGDKATFADSVKSKPKRKILYPDAKMVGWFTTDPNGEFSGKVSKIGKRPVWGYII